MYSDEFMSFATGFSISVSGLGTFVDHVDDKFFALGKRYFVVEFHCLSLLEQTLVNQV